MQDRKHVVCIGAQRTSTTRLHACFHQHPEIFVPEEKELHYFNAVLPPYRDDLKVKKPFITTRLLIKYILKLTDFYSKSKYGARSMRKLFLRGRPVPEYYWSHFSDKDLISCDITPAYSLLSEEGVALIKETAPGSKIIFIVRDPVERMWSELSYHYEKTHKGDLSEKSDDLDFIKTKLTRHHLKRGDYANTYKIFSKYFSDILILVFEEINQDMNKSMRDICEFIGVDAGDKVLGNMPLEQKLNASKKISIPEDIEKILLDFQAENYSNNITLFGNTVSKWKYYDNFIE